MIPEKIQNKVNEVATKRRNFLVKQKERVIEDIFDIFDLFSFDQVTGVNLFYEKGDSTLFIEVDKNKYFYCRMEEEEIEEINTKIEEKIKKIKKMPVNEFEDVKSYLQEHKDEMIFRYFTFDFKECSLTITISNHFEF